MVVNKNKLRWIQITSANSTFVKDVIVNKGGELVMTKDYIISGLKVNKCGKVTKTN
jgi:hypothetical protein